MAGGDVWGPEELWRLEEIKYIDLYRVGWCAGK